MKRILNISAAIVAAISFAACQQTLEISENIINVKVVSDKIIEPEDAVKTYMGENSSTKKPEVKWNEGDAIALYEFVDDATEPTQNPTSNGTRLTEDYHIAEFNVPLRADKETGTTYTYEAIYPAEAVSDGGASPNKFKRVQIPAVQTAQFIGDDYSTANFDPAADVLLGVPVVKASRPTESDYLGFNFKRVGTIGKLTIKNLWDNETVSCVEISLPDKSKLSGYSKIDIKGGEITEAGYTTDEKITVNVPNGAEAAMVTADGINNVIYFRCLSGTWATGTDVTVKVTTDKAIYTKTTALPRDYEFIEGGLTAFSFNMATATREEIKDYSGEYLIVSGEYLLTTFNSSANNYSYVKAEGPALNDFYKVSGIENYVWTVAKLADGSYSFCNKGTGKYLALTDDANQAHSADNADNKTARFNIKEESSVLYIYSCEYATRHLRYNSSSPRFAFYSSTTGSVATLLAYVADERTPFDPVSGLTWDSTGKTVSWTATEGATNGYEYTLDNGTTVKAASTNSIDCSSWSNGDYSVKVRVVSTDTKKTSEWSTAREFTISGGVAAKYYTKVTEALEDWSGKYLIVSGTSAANGTITSKWLKCITVTVDPEKGILSDDSTNAVAVTIEPASTAGQYTIQFNGGKYLGTTNSNDGIKVDDTPGNGFYWTFSFADGLVKITNTIAANRHLRLNGDSGFRTYTGTTGTQATLYKLDEGPVAKVISVAVSGTPTKTAYKAGEEFETTGLIAKATFEDTSVKDVTDDVEWTVTPSPLTAGTTSVSVKASYKDKESAAYVVNGLTVTEPATLSSISVKTAPTKTTYTEGEKFDPTGLVITRNYSDETHDDYAYENHESDFTFSPTTSTALTTSNTSVTITYGGKSVNQTITVNEKVIPTFSSLEDLAAAVLTSGTEVKVSFENVPIKSIYVTSQGYRNGIYFDIQKGGKDIEIYYQDVPETWVAGGTVSGTMTCPWKNFNGTWELAPDNGTWSWNNLSYTAPIAPCETPVISISESGSATISCATTGASIYYTVGTSPADPTNASTLYTGAVAMTDGQTIKAIAYKDGMNPSEVASKKYTAGGGTDPKEYTYTFNSKSWGDATSSWTSGKDGNGYTANQGIQVTSGVTGANATSKSSFTNVSKIVVNYCTNTSKGKGTISVKVGNGTAKSYSVSAPSSGGTTLRNTDDFVFSTPESGTVNITVECGTNSIYINSITITAD